MKRGVVAVVAAGAALGAAVAWNPLLVGLGAGGLALAALGVARPWLPIAGVFLGILLDNLGATGMAMGAVPVTASKLAVVGAMGAWFVHAAVAGRPLVRWHPVLTALSVVLAAMCASVVAHGSLGRGLTDVVGVAMLTVLVALVYSALADQPLEPLFRFMAAALVGAIALTAAQGRGDALTAARATGTMGDPNEWATVVLVLTPLLVGTLAGDRHFSARPLLLALLAAAPLAIVLSRSRAAFVAGLLLVPPCLVLLRRRRILVALAAGSCLVLLPLFADVRAAMERYATLFAAAEGTALTTDASLSERLELRRQATELFLDHWLFGVGPGNFPTASGYVSATGKLKAAHNTYLQVASEQGVVGLLALLALGVTVAAALRDALRRAGAGADRERVIGAAVALGAFALMASTLGLLTLAMGYLVLGIALVVMAQGAASGRVADAG